MSVFNFSRRSQRTHFSDSTQVMLRLAKSFSFVMNVNRCAFAYSHITASAVLPSPAKLM